MAKRGVRTEAGRRYYPDGSYYSGRNAGAAARELEYIDITLRAVSYTHLTLPTT